MLNSFKRIPVREHPELDTIRFLSILLVVLHHQFFTSNAFFKWFTDHGWIGVDIFFGMSGFLITTILLKELEKTGSIELGNFWFRRMLRLWPSWLVTLILSYLMVFALSSHSGEVRYALQAKWWHYFLHFGNYSYVLYDKIHTLYSHYWSLAVEEHFYILWPLLLVGLRKRKHLLLAVWAIIILSVGVRFYHITNGASNKLLSFSTHTRMDELLLGCVLAFYFPKLPALTALKEIVLTSLMFLLYGIGLYVCKENVGSPWFYSLTYSVVGIATCLLIIIAMKGGRFGLRRLLATRLTARLGVLSYGVYLIHLHVNYIVFPLFKKFPLIQSEIGIALINFVVPFVPAYFMYFYLDAYFARFKHKKVSLPSASLEKEA